ncbi:MAG: aminomethyl-transferring glycine dehydrogenase subunit GcvPA [Tissierellia bacterium]|nr:aminomethyl-transferring glycine dehydrogenase subunit GcvPA [Tissierellia bacterium]
MYPYISLTEEEIQEMLQTIGVEKLEDLFADVHDNIKFDRDLDIPEAKSELEIAKYFNNMANKNVTTNDKACFMGGGAYDRYIPSAVGRLTSRSEFYTSYTPYQPEISQGTLRYIFEYQTMMANLTGMEYSNASLYDGGTAIMEAALMTIDKARKKKIVIAGTVAPEAIEILKTYSHARGYEVIVAPMKNMLTDMEELEKIVNDEVGTVIVQSPNYYGYIEDVEKFEKITHSIKKNYLVLSTDPISLGIMKKPADYNVDVCVGEGQSLGIPLSYGGPYLGFLTFNKEFIRKIPGRIVGQTEDRDGLRSFVLTLAAREQHIKRDRATSNICSNQGLNVLAAAIYMSLLGKQGIREVAVQSTQKAHYLYDKLLATGKVKKLSDAPFFDEFTIGFEKSADEVKKALYDADILGGIGLSRCTGDEQDGLIIAVTEKRTKEEMDRFVKVMEEVL